MSAPAIGVIGFGRCGSTMLMKMLEAGGVPPTEGAFPGSYEAEDILAAYKMTPDQLDGHAIKLLTSLEAMHVPPPATRWQFIWLDRDPQQQALSAAKFMIGMGAMPPPTDFIHLARVVRGLRVSFERDRPKLLAQAKQFGPVLELRYEDVLANPSRAVRRIAKLWPDFDRQAAAAVVHERSGKVRPDLAVEIEVGKEFGRVVDTRPLLYPSQTEPAPPREFKPKTGIVDDIEIEET